MKAGTMRPLKKLLGMALFLIAVYYTLGLISAYTGDTFLGVHGWVKGFGGWIHFIAVISVSGLSGYFLWISGKQR